MTEAVSQEAREAAADILQGDRSAMPSYEFEIIASIRAGRFDHHYITQAFAKFERETLARAAHAQGEPVGWMPIDDCPMWELAIVTDGENVAKAQKAECDYGGYYWSIEPEDALEWEPTIWTPFPAGSVSLTHPQPSADLVEALKYYAKDYDSERGCSQWDGGAIARAALAKAGAA